LNLNAAGLFKRSGAASLVLAIAMVGLGAVGAWADELPGQPETPPPSPPAETPEQPGPKPTEAPALAPGAEVEAGPIEVQEAGLGGPSMRPIGSTDGAGASDISAIAGVTSGDSDGVLVPAPPQHERGFDSIVEGGRTGPDPVDGTLIG
jgi:hypothetical protein